MQDVSQEQYNRPAQAIHWITALLVLALLSMGFFMASMDYSPLKLNIYMVHKSFGMIVFGLVLARIVWRFLKPPPPSLKTHAAWEKGLSHFIHLLLYCGLIGMPLSGWMMSSAAEFPNSFFGLFEFPALTGKDEDLFRLTRMIHEVSAMMLVAAIGLHFLGAAKHHIIDKDSTLRRMGGNMLFLLVGGALLLPASGFVAAELTEELFEKEQAEGVSASSSAPAHNAAVTQDADHTASAQSAQGGEMVWTIDQTASSLNVTFQQYSQSVSAQFAGFNGRIAFDPDNLGESKVRIEIDMTSLETGSDDRDSQARSSEWFAAQEYPAAVFESELFTHIESNRYEVQGNLSIRDVTLPLNMPFTLDITDDDQGGQVARMKASLTLKRLDFGVGQGQWAAEDAIANAVGIEVDLSANRTP